MNFERIYSYRFRGVDQKKKLLTWGLIADFLYEKLERPERILDPASGMCEFINAVPSKERWGVDLNEVFINEHADAGEKKVIGSNRKVDLPQNYFDAVFVSNFLEHLHSQEEVAHFLDRMYKVIR